MLNYCIGSLLHPLPCFKLYFIAKNPIKSAGLILQIEVIELNYYRKKEQMILQQRIEFAIEIKNTQSN